MERLKMKIDIEKGHKATCIEVGYMTYLDFDVENLDIDWSQVESLYCKYCTLTIHMKNGDEHKITEYNETETDYKWPKKMIVFDGEWAIMDEE